MPASITTIPVYAPSEKLHSALEQHGNQQPAQRTISPSVADVRDRTIASGDWYLSYKGQSLMGFDVAEGLP